MYKPIIYQDISPIERKLAEEIFASNNVEQTCNAIVSIALYDNDWKWAQDKCLEFLLNNNSDISGIAATCLGHIARVHHNLEKDRVIAILKSRLSDKEIAGRIQDALDDIASYI